MSEVFILGAGFSRAILTEMPLTKDLSAEVLECYRQADTIPPEIRTMIEEDFEKALTFLAQDKPWLREPENLRHKALYLDLTHVIRGTLHHKCRDPLVWGTNRPPLWLEALITYWHTHHSTVVTLNYDTLIERVAGATYWNKRTAPIPTGDLYPVPLTPAQQRAVPLIAKKALETFKLFKLHGSINWFYSGRSDFFGEELYYVPCMGGPDGVFDAAEGHDPENPHWAQIGDKTALIIPPVLDKSVFFQHESIRSMWFQAGEAIKSATRIVCMGYSLPSSDLTMAHFLKTSAPPRSVPFEIVDVVPKLDHFASVLGATQYDFHQSERDLDCIPWFVVKNCVQNDKDKFHVIHMTSWKRRPESSSPDETGTSGEAST